VPTKEWGFLPVPTETRPSAFHPSSAMSGGNARAQNLPVSFLGFLTES
jgi:hypothetical protein